MDKEIQMLRRVQKILDGLQYPGYPFAISGIIDLKDDKCWLGWYGKPMKFNKFITKFDSLLAYQMVGSSLATKGNFLVDTGMEPYERILDADYNDFYIDSLPATKLYFAFYSAYRQYRDTDSIIFFQCDCDIDYADVRVFKRDSTGSAEKEIKKYVDSLELEQY